MPASQFAIRPNIRNHSVLKRDAVIKQVAAAVGPMHSVDLRNYDLLILIEIYKVSGDGVQAKAKKLAYQARNCRTFVA